MGDTTPLTLHFAHQSNAKDNQSFRATMALGNQSTMTFRNWRLGMNFGRRITSIKGAQISEAEIQSGDFYWIQGSPDAPHLLPGSALDIILEGRWTILNESDFPRGCFLRSTNHPIVPVLCSGSIFLSATTKTRPPAEPTPLGLVVPQPKHTEKRDGANFTLTANTNVIAPSHAHTAVKYLIEFLRERQGFTLKTIETDQGDLPLILMEQHVISGPPSSYELEVGHRVVHIRAADPEGFFYGVQTLLQLLPVEVFDAEDRRDRFTIPPLFIVDEPRFSHRGLHLDVVRHFFPVSEVKRLIDMMAQHKLNTFLWHLSDDEGFRIEIPSYPELTRIGAWRGVGQPLGPAYGTGPESYGGYYTAADVHEVVSYAKQRHISIIPEIDIPAHARAILKSLPQLRDPNDDSTYRSIQNYDDNTLSPCLDVTYEILEKHRRNAGPALSRDTLSSRWRRNSQGRMGS